MKKMLPMFLVAFAIVFCCACNAVTPGPSTTRSMAAQVSVSTTAAAKESSSHAQKPDASAGETTEETIEGMTGETGEETDGETSEETMTEETTAKETKVVSSRTAEEDGTDRETVYVISAVNVRDAATKNSNVVGTLSAGEAVTKLSEDGGWTKILYNGAECYVSTSYLSD